MYRGEVVWGRSKWTRSEANSDNRAVTQVDPSEWIVHQVPSLRIVSDELWNTVQRIQTAKSPRHDAISRGVIKGRAGRIRNRASGHDSSSIGLALCSCALAARTTSATDSVISFVPRTSRTAATTTCGFRREDANAAMFDLLRYECFSDQQIALGKQRIEAALKERAKEEERATRDAVSGVDTRKLDQEIKALRKMALRPAAMAAAIAEIEKERQDLLAEASGKKDKVEGRARQLLARLPEIVDEYVKQLQNGLKLLTDERAVHDARGRQRGDYWWTGKLCLRQLPNGTQ